MKALDLLARRAMAPLLLLLPTLLAACSNATTGNDNGKLPPPPACTFVNPIASGADPWVVRRGGFYYLVESGGRGISVYKSANLTDIKKAAGVRVWNAPDVGWNRSNLWAPELHFLDGRWYIYYAAGPSDGGPFVDQRAGVLESAGDDPQGAYVDRGMLYTGNDVAGGSGAIWAIDLTVGRIGGQLYAVWSGWEDNNPAPGPLPDRKPQQTYIARMSNPWTIATSRVQIAAPTASWERGTELDLQEGPSFLQRGDQTFVIYSTRESWLPDYRLGQLRLTSPTADPLSPASWVKTGPVFIGAGGVGVWGVGHASFTTSPDGSEDWIVYHAKSQSAPGWDDRVIRMQKFTWNADNSPNFGTPVPNAQAVAQPAGQCQG